MVSEFGKNVYNVFEEYISRTGNVDDVLFVLDKLARVSGKNVDDVGLESIGSDLSFVEKNGSRKSENCPILESLERNPSFRYGK